MEILWRWAYLLILDQEFLGCIVKKWEEGDSLEESWETSFRIVRRWGHESRLEILRLSFPKNHRAKKYGWKWLTSNDLTSNDLSCFEPGKVNCIYQSQLSIIANKVKGRGLSGLSTRNERVVNSGSSLILSFIVCYFLIDKLKRKTKAANPCAWPKYIKIIFISKVNINNIIIQWVREKFYFNRLSI